MIRVLHVCDSLEISGGVQAVIMNIFRRIDRSKVIFDFAVYDCPKSQSYREEIEQLGGVIIVVDNLGTAGILGFYRQFERLLKNKAYDAIHAHNIHHNGLILLAAKKNGIPIRISHSHQSNDDRNTSLPRRIFTRLLKFLNIMVATKLVACSDLAAKFLYGNRDYCFLPNAVDIRKISDLPSNYTLLKDFGIPTRTKILLHVGRLCKQKNQFFDLKIMQILKDYPFVLLLAGSGEDEEKLKKSVSEKHLESKIRFIGLRNDIPELMKVADAVLLPSPYEGLPMVIVEAQATGCPALISNTITQMVDFHLGLVKFLPIVDEKVWAEEILNMPPKKIIDAQNIKKIMTNLKFDINANLESWYSLYNYK